MWTFLKKNSAVRLKRAANGVLQRNRLREAFLERFPDSGNLLSDMRICRAMGGLLSYLFETQKSTLEQLKTPEVYEPELYMTVDHTARTNLELFETLRTARKTGIAFVGA